MADVHWGAVTAWADVAAAASWSALANGSSIVSASFDNTTLDDQFAEVSFVCVTSTMAVSAGGHLAVYVLPRLHDDTNFPNGATSGTTLPGGSYLRGVMSCPTGTISPAGYVLVPIPAGFYRIGVVNRLGAALPTTTTNITCRYRTVSEAVV